MFFQEMAQPRVGLAGFRDWLMAVVLTNHKYYNIDALSRHKYTSQ